MSKEEQLQEELDKAQIILAFVLQETGPVNVPLGKPLGDNSAIEVVENSDTQVMTVRLVAE